MLRPASKRAFSKSYCFTPSRLAGGCDLNDFAVGGDGAYETAGLYEDNYPVQELMDHLQKTTHSGPGGPRGDQWTSPVLDEPVWDNPFLRDLRSRARDFMRTQGDGNRFAYVSRIQFTEAQRAALEAAGFTEPSDWIVRREGRFNVLVTHHGSRGLGADLCERGQVGARRWCDENAKDIPDAAVWLAYDSSEGKPYWAALQYVGRWTRENHAQIPAAFLRRIGQPVGHALKEPLVCGADLSAGLRAQDRGDLVGRYARDRDVLAKTTRTCSSRCRLRFAGWLRYGGRHGSRSKPSSSGGRLCRARFNPALLRPGRRLCAVSPVLSTGSDRDAAISRRAQPRGSRCRHRLR